jgi:hypothetical protein
VKTAQGMLIFDTMGWQTDGCTSMVEYAIDVDQRTALPTWSYATADCLYNQYMGNAVETHSGNRMLVLSMHAQVDEVTPDGDLARRFTLPYDYTINYASAVEHLYPDAEPRQ